MPACYATPDSPAPPGETRFRGYLGQAAMFSGKEGLRVADVPDGTSNTILIVQADDPVLWTWPNELPFMPGFEVGRIDRSEPGRCLVGMADGRVLPILRPTEAVLRAMISRNGGEILGEPTRFTPELALIGALREAESPWRSRPGAGPPPGPTWDQPEPAAPGTQPGAGPMGVMLGPPAGSVEDRLRRVEEKLDRLIERLDAAGVGRPAP